MLPADGPVLDLDAPDADEQLAALYAPDAAASMRLMMIATLDGRTTGGDGTSASISTPVDRRVLAAVRRNADAIVVGAETVRRESVGRPPGTAVAVVSASGALEGHRLRPAADGAPLLIVTTPTGATRASAALGALPHELIVLDAHEDARPAPAEILRAVRERAGAHLVCEGGPSLARQLLDAGAVDEVCLTTAPSLGGGGEPLTTRDTTARALHPRQLLLDEAGFVYGRWRVDGA